jgi:hypothetical protein
MSQTQYELSQTDNQSERQKVEDISHKEPLRFYFKKPSSNGESKFINFINEMGINSVAELETHPVTLCRYSDNEMV